ncbi:MAG: hypothetical protein J5I65_15820 [Aridibacter famidurans]|nr:hypothetical protein [Aridibacter famidurans]
MEDRKLAEDGARRAANYEKIKDEVKSDVGGEIAAEADKPTDSEISREKDIARDMRGKAIEEVEQTEREVERGRAAARFAQVVDYVFYLIYGFLGIRLLLELLAARDSAKFVQWIKSITGVFYWPFEGIVRSPSVEGHTLALPIIVALVSYLLLHFAIIGLLRMIAHRKTVI